MSEIAIEGVQPRCPYCHEDIGPGAAQTACVACRAWHHRACWDEAEDRCCACGASSPQQRSRRGLMRLYSVAVLGTWLLVSVAGTAALSWGAGLGFFTSLLLGNGLGAGAGYALSRLLDSFAGFAIEEELEPEFAEQSLQNSEPFSPKASLKELAIGMLSLYLLIAACLLLDYGLGFVLERGLLRNLGVGLGVAALALPILELFKRRAAKPAVCAEAAEAASFAKEKGKKTALRSREKSR